jgi:hypothetical protein
LLKLTTTSSTTTKMSPKLDRRSKSGLAGAAAAGSLALTASATPSGAVEVASDADRRVSEEIGHGLDVYARLEPRGRNRVPNRVNTNAGEARLLRGDLNGAQDFACGVRVPVARPLRPDAGVRQHPERPLPRF